MDPNACLRRFKAALAAHDYQEAKSAASDLRDWILNGGFEPDWTDLDRALFALFVQLHITRSYRP